MRIQELERRVPAFLHRFGQGRLPKQPEGNMRPDWYKAAIDGHGETIARLIGEDADIDGRDRHGQTALMLAARNGRDDVVRILLSGGADRDVTAKYGLSALMLAVVNHHAGIARQLVDAGADFSIRGRGAPGFAGKTAQDLARDAGLRELAAYIARAERLNGNRG